MITRPTLSVVVPLRNEEAVLPELHRRLMLAVEAVPGGCEILFVDDGSTDRTREILEQAAANNGRVGSSGSAATSARRSPSAPGFARRGGTRWS